MIGTEQGEEHKWPLAGVLDVVAHVARSVADVTCLVVERAGLTAGGEDGYAPLAGEIVLPFVGVRVPVKLADRARFDFDSGGRDRLRHGEIARVGDAYRTARRLGRLLRHHMPRVRLLRLFDRGWRRVLAQRWRHFTREHVTSVPDVGRERVEGGFVDTKVFGQDLPRRVREPIADEECLVL